jgi:hypothetical protein
VHGDESDDEANEVVEVVEGVGYEGDGVGVETDGDLGEEKGEGNGDYGAEAGFAGDGHRDRVKMVSRMRVAGRKDKVVENVGEVEDVSR